MYCIKIVPIIDFSIILLIILQRLEQEERERQTEWERLQLAQAKAGILAEREQERVRKQLKKQLTDENCRLASEQQSL